MFTALSGLFALPPRPAAGTGQLRKKLVIAHRGASGYLPEHTLPAKAMAYAMGADYLEQDLVMTRDGQLIVLHDIHLDTVTDVAQKFPGRARADKRYYAIDFTLAEVRTLQVRERFDLLSGKPVYPRRYPASGSRFVLHTFEEELEMIAGLNRSTRRRVGIYPELKSPAFHLQEGQDIALAVLPLLERFAYTEADSHCFLQCFDPVTLRRLRTELGSRLAMIQLIGDNSWNEADTDYNAMLCEAGMRDIATYADGIGPWIPQVVDNSTGRVKELVQWAHAAGLLVHPYTLRADELPRWAPDFEVLARKVLFEAGADGAFTDFPDRLVQLLEGN